MSKIYGKAVYRLRYKQSRKSMAPSQKLSFNRFIGVRMRPVPVNSVWPINVIRIISRRTPLGEPHLRRSRGGSFIGFTGVC